MRPLRALWIVYDSSCGLCTTVKEWILRQAPLVTIHMVAAGSEEALLRFPQLPAGELAVIGDTGEVWLGDRAWIICLWALRDYRDWSIRLSSPMLLPLARQAFSTLSSSRGMVSSFLGWRSEQDIQRDLQGILVPRCESQRP